MKKTLSFCFFLFLFVKVYAQDQPVKLFPVVNGAVMYEKIVNVADKDQTTLHLAGFNWILKNFKEHETVNEQLDIGQSIYDVKFPVDDYTVDFRLQIDSKDNKYRYRFYNIKHTVTGKDESSMFAKYLVNVTAETDNSIVSGEGKYSKGQRKAAQKVIILIDEFMDKVANALNAAMTKKAENF